MTKPIYGYGLCKCGCGEKTRISAASKDGYKKGEPLQYVRGHQSRRMHRNHYEEEDRGYGSNCWVWRRHVNAHGSPQDGTTGQTGYRLLWDRWMEPPPKGLIPVPVCGERLCVNPFHMRLMTRSESIRYYQGKPTGERLKRMIERSAKLSYEQVRHVRTSDESDEELAARYGVAARTIKDVRDRRTWREVA